MKVFCISISIVIIAASILFELPYVGVTMAGILVTIMTVFGLVGYFTRPNEVKKLEREIGKFTSETTKALIEELEKFNKELEKNLCKKRKLEIKRKLDEINKKINES